MTYKLTFLKSAKKEWDKLGETVKSQLKKKIVERLENPRVAKDKLTGMEDCFKIKLKSSGYRLVYRVLEKRVVVQIIAIARRDKEEVYRLAHTRTSH
jgi:mRNA interferase RelE/StbE